MNIKKLEVLFNGFVNEFGFETGYDLVGDIDCYLYCTAYIRNLYDGHSYNVILDVSCKTYFENVDEILDYLISKENFARQMQEHFNPTQQTISYKQLGNILSDKLNELADKDGFNS